MPNRLSLVPHAVVLCGPQGGPALHPLPGPPALLPVGNEPAVGFLLRALEAAGTRSAILVRFLFFFGSLGEALVLRCCPWRRRCACAGGWTAGCPVCGSKVAD